MAYSDVCIQLTICNESVTSITFSAIWKYSELSLFRSPMGLPQVAGISRWPHFRVPRDTRGYNRDSVTCIFSSMQGHCDWFVASLAVTVNNQSVLLVARYQYQARLAKDLAAYCGRSFGFEAANKNHLPPPSTNQK